MTENSILGLSFASDNKDVPKEFISYVKNFNLLDCGWYRKNIFSWKFRNSSDSALIEEYAEKLNLDTIYLSQQQCKVPKLMLADMDMTLVACETLNEVAKYAGFGDEIARITEDAMEGRVDFQESLDKRMALLNGQPADLFLSVAKDIPLTKGAKEFIASLKRLGCKCVLVSGGFLPVANTVAKRLKIDYVFANVLQQENNIIKYVPNCVQLIDVAEKANILKRFIKKDGLKLEETMAIGDGANDIEMLKNAGLGISYRGKKELSKIANIRIKFNDLSVLPSLPFLNKDFSWKNKL